MSYATLDLTGMNIDTAERAFAVLTCSFGEGYADGALVGSAGGIHRWKLSSGCLPGDVSYGNLIGGEARFDYYWKFFKARMAADNEVFIIEWRGQTYHACFVETEIDAEIFTYDLFGGGVEIEQQRVTGETYNADGSIP